MDNTDFEIELQDTPEQDKESVRLPVNILSFGEIENDDIKVYIKQDVYKALEKLAESDTSKELGSILIGDYSEELGKTHVIISNYIEAKYTDASASTLTFTHETWDYVHKEQDKLYPDKKIIGWQHTHPNYGIFLSNYDMFIQENFFNMPFQIAYVIDPVQNLRGFFQWKNGKVEKLKGYFIYDDVSKPIKVEQKKVKKKEEESAPRKTNKALVSVVAVLCAACLALGGALIAVRHDYKEQSKMVMDINTQLSEQKDLIDKQSSAISTLRQCFIDGILGGSEKAAAEDLIAKIENNEIEVENKDELLEELRAFVDGNEDGERVVFSMYTVREGDTISSICADRGVDYSSAIDMILAMNGIDDANMIHVGQELLIPDVGKTE